MSLLYENIIEIGFVKWGPKPEIIVLEILKDNIYSHDYDISYLDEEVEI